jgi:hypothetical protein
VRDKILAFDYENALTLRIADQDIDVPEMLLKLTICTDSLYPRFNA